MGGANDIVKKTHDWSNPGGVATGKIHGELPMGSWGPV